MSGQGKSKVVVGLEVEIQVTDDVSPPRQDSRVAGWEGGEKG